MFSIICGVFLIAMSTGAFWYLLPRNGQENPLVKNSGVGSMVTIVIMSFLTIGVALLFSGFIG
jgi:hypothetical protein